MLSIYIGLLADFDLCACDQKSMAKLTKSTTIPVNCGSNARVSDLLSHARNVAASSPTTCDHVTTTDLHPAASVKRRTISDPEELFLLSPPPPMYVPPALTVE